ncbi:FecR family protein [Steroidobacter sp.]|uniref:FecR family protein n=1 Tax=Steroidobacter sp. TaxID=1978227 RepID=UPI001A40F72C|nr:FecR domain-containing protein [Steroidobacter sp.]MBL8271817.1 FecR domain-containing protein [Steroidobacter sp.]
MPPGSERTRIVSQEAAYWYIRGSDERGMSRADRQLFVQWLKRSPENIAELLRVSGVDGKFPGLRLLERVVEFDDSNVLGVDFGSSALQYDYQPSDSVEDTSPRQAGFRPAWALAAMLGCIALAFVLAFSLFESAPDGTIETAASQWQHMTLEDGSTVHVDARSRLKVEFTEQRRVVYLTEGQAVFDVEKDPRRPFTVRTPLIDVTAVGTRFGVALDSGVTATVSEGTVKVTAHGNLNDPKAVLLKAGQELQVGGSATVGIPASDPPAVDLSTVPVIVVDADRKLDWANGWLQFEGETIGQVVREFNRRNVQQIQIVDGSIADRRLVGYYRLRVDRPESLAKLLENQEGIIVTRDSSGSQLRLQLE